jgi:hypothetical protein
MGCEDTTYFLFAKLLPLKSWNYWFFSGCHLVFFLKTIGLKMQAQRIILI